MALATDKYTQTETRENQARKLNKLLEYIEALEARIKVLEDAAA